MRVFVALFVFFAVGVSPLHAQWLNRVFRLPVFSSKTLSMVQRRALVSNYTFKVEQALMHNRLNLPAQRLPEFKQSIQTYYKTVAHRLPDIAVKPMSTAGNVLEELALFFPTSLNPQNVLIENIPGIVKPTETYLSALFADVWGNWLESVAAAEELGERTVSRSNVKKAQALQRDFAETFARQYAALPADQKDLRVQLSLVMKHVQQQTGWGELEIGELQHYFEGVMAPMIANQKKLTALEFLQAYDVMAVAAEMGPRYQKRVARGASSLPAFVVSESIQRIRQRLSDDAITSLATKRLERLKNWREGLFGR